VRALCPGCRAFGQDDVVIVCATTKHVSRVPRPGRPCRDAPCSFVAFPALKGWANFASSLPRLGARRRRLLSSVDRGRAAGGILRSFTRVAVQDDVGTLAGFSGSVAS
jgi:hypothetical protein